MKRFLFSIVFLLIVGNVQAATRTWEGDDLTNPTYYNDADNWGGTVPEAGDDVVFNNNKNCNVECKGVVVRTEDENKGGFNIAVFFNEINDGQRKKISQYINKLLPQTSCIPQRL